ncbi:hypothetical protein [Hymenobacter fodinae]|uniref:Lipoprotein n=1 Tax=Hymenobacter fodinae TaxID=2510796 RepID=A0A4Z0P9X0_9BACT|nr:hypothetical protein [Hymenobacter fodinae]TGE08257.1 hypothetical protein EU556_11075 [Hymenobacter fodinae]
MKSLLTGLFLAFLATACSPSDPDAALHERISSTIKASAGDPESYQPARWSKATPWRQQDENGLRAKVLRDSIAKLKPHAELKYRQVQEATRLGMKEQPQWKAEWLQEEEAMIALGKQALALEQQKDTTRLGQQLVHAYREKNAAGALVLDSALFIVLKDNSVRWRPF